MDEELVQQQEVAEENVPEMPADFPEMPEGGFQGGPGMPPPPQGGMGGPGMPPPQGGMGGPQQCGFGGGQGGPGMPPPPEGDFEMPEGFEGEAPAEAPAEEA